MSYFNSNINNNINDYLKENIILEDIYLTPESLYIIVNNIKTVKLIKNNISEGILIKKIINLYFNKINYNNINSIPIYLMLSISSHKLNQEFIKMSTDTLLNIIKKKYINSEIIISEIMSSLNKQNQSYFNLYIKDKLIPILKNIESFTTSDDNNDTNNSMILLNDKLYLDGIDKEYNPVLYSLNDIKVKNFNNYFKNDDITKYNDTQLFYYINNLENGIKLKHISSKKLDRVTNNINLTRQQKTNRSKFYVLLIKFLDNILINKQLLKSRLINYRELIIYIDKNKNNDILRLTPEDIIKKSHFNIDIKNIKTINDFDQLDETLFNQYKLNILRNMSADQLRKSVNFMKLLKKLYENNKNGYFKFIDYVKNKTVYNFKNLENIENEQINLLISNLNNLELHYLINLSNVDTLKNNLYNDNIKQYILTL